MIAVFIAGSLLLARAWLQDDPNRVVAEALAAIDAGRFDEALRLIDGLESREQTQPHAHLLRGRLLLKQNEPAAALRELEQAPNDVPWRTTSWLARGEALYRLGRLAEALSLFQLAAAAETEQVDAHRWLGAVYYDLGAMDAASAEMQIVTRLAPDDFRPHYLLGVMELDFERYELAAERLTAALDRNPPADVQEEIVLELARALVKGRRYDDALSKLEAAPKTADAQALRANCLIAMGRVDDALSQLDEVLGSAPDHRDALLLRGQLAVAESRPHDALGSFERILKADPHDYEARYELAQVYAALGAVERQEEELRTMQESRDLVTRLAELNRRAILEPGNAELRAQLAKVCRELGKIELAEMWERAAIALRPTDAPDRDSD